MSIKFQFLGTCAADFSPKLKSECTDRFDMNACCGDRAAWINYEFAPFMFEKM